MMDDKQIFDLANALQPGDGVGDETLHELSQRDCMPPTVTCSVVFVCLF